MLKTGARLRSQVCTTEVIVVRAGSGDVTLTCGGQPMIDPAGSPAEGLTPAGDLAGGTMIGKRYTDTAGSVEVLATKSGEGSLALGDEVLALKSAKPLPSSD
ncbi:hypothetical protein ACFVKB_10450 [Rhodococcus sp. NPDC127530]|uniref:hypothetical protein n=1 Tax=unclassified Rhodococcus (in: high G+C Gram-positive bacteria) TaxID=192944 RepID=UPI003630F4FE